MANQKPGEGSEDGVAILLGVSEIPQLVGQEEG